MGTIEFLLNVISNVAGELIFLAVSALVAFLFFRIRKSHEKFGRGKFTASPDGNMAVMEEGGDLYAIGGGRVRNLTHSPEFEYAPVWSPNNRWFAFRRNRGKVWEIVVADAINGKMLFIAQIGTDRKIHWNEGSDLVIDLGGSAMTVKRAELAKGLV